MFIKQTLLPHTTTQCKECAAVIVAHGGLRFQMGLIVGVSETAFSDALMFCHVNHVFSSFMILLNNLHTGLNHSSNARKCFLFLFLGISVSGWSSVTESTSLLPFLPLSLGLSWERYCYLWPKHDHFQLIPFRRQTWGTLRKYVQLSDVWVT